jgi:hypothetical protein
MSLPAAIDWTWTYLSLLPVRWQGGTGGCWGATLCYAMEMRAILQGYPARQLSMRYSLYMDGRYDNNGSYVDAVVQDALEGICLESLMPMPSYIGVDTTTQAYSTATWAALRTAPSAAARADAPNQVLTDWARFSYSSLTDLKLKAQTAIAAGYPLFLLTATRTHVMCAWGYDDSGLIGLDSRSQNAFPFHLSWNQIGGIDGMVRGVKFANATMGPPPVMLPKPGAPPPVIPPPPPPPPPPTGNIALLNDIITIAQAAIDAGG